MGTFSGTIYTAKTQTDTYEVNNEPVNWIILGVGSHSNAFVESVSNYLFSTIKNNDYLFSNGEYYFDNQHETFSPAGQLIDSTINAKTYIMGKVKDSIKVHTEIPKGCMLVLSEKLLGQMYFNSSGAVNTYFYNANSVSYTIYAIGNYGNRYRYHGDQNITSATQTWTNKTDGSLYSYHPSTYQNFCIEDYLTTNVQGTATLIGSTTNQSYLWWLRTASTGVTSVAKVVPEGYPTGGDWPYCSYGVRPAMVMKLA